MSRRTKPQSYEDAVTRRSEKHRAIADMVAKRAESEEKRRPPARKR